MTVPLGGGGGETRLVKYPRTQHIAGSRLQAGDEDLETVPFAVVAGRPLVVEEKVDGANCAISFDDDGKLRLQSRGHFLSGGPRERQFSLLKPWAQSRQGAWQEVLGSRYVVYGEWLYARHTVFYDALPHYFMEFDVLDRAHGTFLSTPARAALLDGLSLYSVPMLACGRLNWIQVMAQLGPSHFKTPEWRDRLRHHAADLGQDVDRVLAETDSSDVMEGLYIKVEDDDIVHARYKFVRSGFQATVSNSGSHWLDRPLLSNLLAPGVDLFAT